MKRFLPAVFLLLFTACDPTGSGCQLAPLQRDLQISSLGHQALEFYLPPGSAPAVSQVVLDLLAGSEADRLTGLLPVLTGSLGGPLEFVSSETELVVAITSLAASPAEGKIGVEVELEAVHKTIPLEVLTDGEPLRTCFIDVAVPARGLSVGLIVESDYSGKLRIRVEGEPLVSNGSVVTELELDCPQQPGSVVDATVVEAVESVYAQAVEQLTADLAEVTTLVLGLDANLSGSLGPNDSELSAHVMVHTGPFAEVSQDGTLRLGLTGGIESEQAACIPEGAPQLPPGDEPGAVFKDFVPVTQEAYTMGISISHGFLAQALAAAYRGGLLCRVASAGDLSGVEMDWYFEALEDFDNPDTVRVALWPGHPPVLEFSNPVLSQGEMLPRLILGLADLQVDLYTTFEGADVRLLGLTIDVTAKLVPVLDGQNLYFWPAEVSVANPQVGFSTLLTETGSQLNTRVVQAIERVLAAVVENTPAIQIPRPEGAAGELLGAESVDGRLVLYFNP